MAETIEMSERWLEDSLRNAEVVAAHEKTMFLHRVAILGATATKNHLQGEENRRETQDIQWGRFHSLGAVRQWTPVTWQSSPVYLGDTEENELGFSHEFTAFHVSGILETRTTRSIKGVKRTETLMDETYTVLRLLGNQASNPSELITDPRKTPAWIDRNYTCRDQRPSILWSPEGQIGDYENRTRQIAEFMKELAILAHAAAPDKEIMRHLEYDAIHVSKQIKKVSEIPNQNMRWA